MVASDLSGSLQKCDRIYGKADYNEREEYKLIWGVATTFSELGHFAMYRDLDLVFTRSSWSDFV